MPDADGVRPGPLGDPAFRWCFGGTSALGGLALGLGGGEGGHNGLRSITRSLGTKDYLRVRVGIGRPPGRMDAADFVLRDFSGTERKELPITLEEAADAVELLVERGLVAAQDRYHAPTA